ncbi:hypothetical protein MH215_13885 [Paenibacillus sp. ACRSA]|uniref:DUF6199 family natural product biosynthesis protein n=1 Tax=Paenibacillus sp. ACRSA TaxID=2918211 RepID=UPI001EF3DCDE|nr:DUF6199 family natural product biosynthesis protein [Paenibacillus sp. ACRSA]MCG7378088.1 hypothetical protein [Paenibacillus sp. ACRSA]
MSAFIGVLALILGALFAIWPYLGWYLRLGWRLKDAEPSDLALSVDRILGVVLVIIGLILIVSSCSTGSQSNHTWAEQFKKKLDAGQVKEISIGMFNPTTLSEEETNTVVQLIQHAELRPFDTGNAFGSSNAGKITFMDGLSVELVIWGSSGGIELHPDATQTKYEIMSEELKEWFTTNYSEE